MSAIRVSELTKSFGSIVAVNRVSFEVQENSIFGFLGPNGAGKTTTINILCTLLKPTSGEASVYGFDCVKEPAKVRQAIGIVFQDSTLDKDLTAYENLLYHAILYNVDRKLRKTRVEEALRFVGLYDRRNDLVKRFSGGMRRRLEVARAVVHQPKVLFLDEPTLGLDPQSRASLWDFIKRLPSEKGVTVFMTTHYMEEAEVCDRIAIIDKGRIIAEGSPEELKKTVGGDIVYLKTRDNFAAKDILERALGLKPVLREKEMFIPVKKGETLIPEIIRLLGESVISVRLQKPTLNDVFLKLTGKHIRDEEWDSTDEFREAIRAYRRRFDRG
jgi:ABC-2 type transport system ATP-binding protein